MAWRSVVWSPEHLPALVTLLRESFGVQQSLDHVTWKHLEGPWGPSRGQLALDDNDEVVGVRLVTPWRVRWGSARGTVLRCFDGAVAARARRQGIFADLVGHVLRDEREGDALALVSTCVPASRAAYKKLGWSILPPQVTVNSLAGLSTAAIEDIPARAVPPPQSQGLLHTDWDSDALTWRVDPRSGHTYAAARLRNGSTPHGLVYRISRLRGVRLLVVVLSSGSLRERRQLTGAVALHQRCPVVIQQGSTARGEAASRLRWTQDGSVLAVGSLRSVHEDPEPGLASSWALQGADLEGVL